VFVFLDESGDTGFKFRRGSSDFFVVSIVITENPDAIDATMRTLRNSLGYREHHEFKFSKSNQRVREEFLRLVSRLPIRVRTVVIDKRLMNHPSLSDQESFYEFVVKLLLSHSFAQLSDATLIIDESDRSRRNQRSLAARIKRAGGSESPERIRRVKYWNSRSHGALQVADMICGAVMAAANGEGTYLEIVSRVIESEWHWSPHNLD
jgi:hypothetical protein